MVPLDHFGTLGCCNAFETFHLGQPETFRLGQKRLGPDWKLWGADPDKASPFDVVTKGEGTFSFRVVPVRTSGLASPSPMPGDRPDFSVIVDQTNPKIRITSARFGDGVDAGSLIIGYECKDEHLTKRPISLASGGFS